MAATVGSSASAQRTYSIPPEKGVVITAPISGWSSNKACVIDPTTGGQYRCINSGSIYQVITAGTTAASGGPRGTGSNITDGTVHWKFLGQDPGQAVTTGSQIVAYVARGVQSTLPSGSAGIPPIDNLGGAFTTMGNFTYNGFADSFCGVFYRSTPVTTTGSYQLIAQFGGTSNGSGAGDELTMGYMEIRNVPFGAPHTSSHTEVANSTAAGICQAATITTTKPCIIVSIWAGNGNVLSPGQSHTAVPLNGLTMVSGCNDLICLGTNGYIQVAVATRLATASLTPFAEQWSVGSTTGEGAQLFTLAFEDTTLTGSAAISEAADTASGAGTITNVGSATITLASDTTATTGGPVVLGSGSITLAGDTAATTGGPVLLGSGSVTLAGDIISAAGNVILLGSGSLTDGTDSLSGTATSTLFGSGSITLSGDSISAAGNVILIGSGSLSEDLDTASGAGTITNVGSLAATDGVDSSTSAGGPVLIGSGSIAGASDTISATGNVILIGSGSNQIGLDTISAAGNVIMVGSGSIGDDPETILTSGGPVLIGSGSNSLSGDTAAGTGLFNAVIGSADLTDGADSITSVAAATNVGSGSVSLSGDSVVSAGTITNVGSAAMTDGSDTLTAASSQLMTGSADLTDGADSVSGFGFGPLMGSAAITLADDELTSDEPAPPANFRVLPLTPQSDLPRGPGVPFGGGGRRLPFRID